MIISSEQKIGSIVLYNKQNFINFCLITRAEIVMGRRSGPDREKCGPDRVICLAPDQ